MTNLTDKKPEELRTMLAEKREALRAFRFDMAGAKSRNVREAHNLRKDIARIQTALTAQRTA